MGEGLANPTDPHHTPTVIQPSTQPQKTQKPRKPKRKDTQVPQPSDPSDPSDNVGDEAVYKELGDSLVRATTTASSLEAKQDSGYTIQSDEDSLKLNELMELYDAEMFDVDDLDGEDMIVAGQKENVVAEQEVAAKDVYLTVDEVTLAQALVALKSVKPKVKGNVIEELSIPVSVASASTKVSAAITTIATIPTPRKGVVIQELGESITTKSTPTISSQQAQDKGKGIMIEEPVKPTKKKHQISLDEEVALKLQAEFDEEERLAREKAEKEKRSQCCLNWRMG
ncbi:hypothetical protein Tco_1222872 [Tanacetum coccineum]